MSLPAEMETNGRGVRCVGGADPNHHRRHDRHHKALGQAGAATFVAAVEDHNGRMVADTLDLVDKFTPDGCRRRAGNPDAAPRELHVQISAEAGSQHSQRELWKRAKAQMRGVKRRRGAQ